MPQDDIDDIPSIVPTRDAEHHRPAAASRPARGGKSAGNRRAPAGATPGGGGGSGLMVKLFLLVALVVAAGACGWAWQLQGQLAQAGEEMEAYARRIGDLEDRLSDTDEGMSQNAAVQAAKIRELDSEVRKLWDNVWKKSKERLAALEASSSKQGKQLAATATSVESSEAQLESMSQDLAKLKSVAGDLERLMASARTNQAEVERVADTLNRIDLEINKLNNRVSSSEESIKSIDAFRRQMMSSLTDLQAAVRVLQAEP